MRPILRLLALAVLASAGCKPPPPPATPTPSPTPAPTVAPTPTAPPSPTPTPTPFVPRKPMEVGMLFNGLQYKWSVQTQSGDTAARDREDDGAYKIELNLKIRTPRPAVTMGDLAVSNPELPALLPGLAPLLGAATVSPHYEELYRRKLDWLKERLERLDQILSRHNYYDCDTILDLRAPGTGRRALLVQGDMDVNVDGSDGDRNVEVDGSGQFFQPQTSYRWPKTTKRPNPFIARFEERIRNAEAELAKPGTTDARRQELSESITLAKRNVADLKGASFLVSKADPSIVLPTFMLRDTGISVGDYAVVIHDNRMFPSIVGDAGPSYKVGEASLRLCDEINRTGTPLARPVSDLAVTYLVFPGSADEKRSAPDLDRWHARCAGLLAELGLPSDSLHRWENIVPPWPTPTPSPAPSPSPPAAPAPTSSPGTNAPAAVASPPSTATPSPSPAA